ncbi:uncharacterized protein LOC124836257 [Vigna umbellata]|uniref:uncharacterized protein LOC124836257 n=1 Tax=Vigna umbellata TaxID=87088 RepID=UPI001F5F63F8|nr:uncharacterized protein LOC124836257 [Vigna umbellata]
MVDRQPQSIPDITFTDADFHAPDPDHDDPMVITAEIARYDVSKVLVDQGSSVNILYWSTFKKMDLSEDLIAPFNEQIVGFSGEKVNTRGTSTYELDSGHVGMHQSLESGSYWRARGAETAAIDFDPRTNIDERLHPQGDVKPLPLGADASKTTTIGGSLALNDEQDLAQMLRTNADLFAWVAADMSGIHPGIMAHKLSIFREARPIAQKKRRFGEDKRDAIQVEVKKLMSAQFIREITYTTWLSNVVMVKKSNGQWRMCVDFTDLNKACPKDSYPLPSIDWLVDGASGHVVLSFLDAYSGYN